MREWQGHNARSGCNDENVGDVAHSLSPLPRNRWAKRPLGRAEATPPAKTGDKRITETWLWRFPPPRSCCPRYNRSMQQTIHPLRVSTRGRGLIEITAAVRDWLDKQEITTG